MRREIKIVRDEVRGEEYVTHLASEERRAIGKEDMASLYAPRTEIAALDVEEGHDRAELRVGGEVYFAGIIEDVVRNDDTSEIIVESWERLAERAEPTSSEDIWENAPDNDIIRDALADVPELEAGSIVETNPTVSLLFSHASQAFKVRKTADVSPGLVRYNPDKTVDYGNLGKNKTHVTLSPRRENVERDFEIEKKASYEEVTHLRMLGTGEGEHQIQATAVADDYDGGVQVWKVYTDKGIAEEGTLQDKADHFVEELKTSLVDVELTVKGVRCEVGDHFRVYVPSEELDDYLQVVEHKRVIDTEGLKHEVTLSNHRDTREDPEEKNRADLEHYNQAIEGATMRISHGGSRQPVNPDHNWTTLMPYEDDIVRERRLDVVVEGNPYRAYSSGATDNADFESAVVGQGDIRELTVSADTWTTVASIEPDADTSELTAQFIYEFESADPDVTAGTTHLNFRLETSRSDGVGHIPGADGAFVRTSGDDSSTVLLRLPENTNGQPVRLQMRRETSGTSLTVRGQTLWQGSGRHTHDPEPGIIETFEGLTQYYPSNCDILINGESLGVSLGDGGSEFSESVDIRGELEQGQDNRIEVTSDTLGHLQVFILGEAYRQILGTGG